MLIWFLLLGGVEVSVAGKTPTLLYFDLALVLWLVVKVFCTDFWPDFSGWIFRLAVPYLLIGVISALANLSGAFRSIAALKVVVVALLTYGITRKNAPSVFGLSAWGAVVGGLLLYDYATIFIMGYNNITQLNASKNLIGIVLGRSNYVASILLLLIPIGLAGVLIYKGWKRVTCAVFSTAMLGGLMATMSRGAMAALAVSFLICVPLLRKIGLNWKHVTALAVILIMVFLLLPATLIQEDIALISYRWNNPDFGRKELLLASWDAFEQNPVLGVGPGQVGYAIAQRVSAPTDDEQYMHAHNLVLDALSENGAIGGLIFLAMIAAVLFSAWKAATHSSSPLTVALFIAVCAAVLHEMVESSFPGEQFSVVFWIVAGIIAKSNPAWKIRLHSA